MPPRSSASLTLFAATGSCTREQEEQALLRARALAARRRQRGPGSGRRDDAEADGAQEDNHDSEVAHRICARVVFDSMSR